MHHLEWEPPHPSRMVRGKCSSPSWYGERLRSPSAHWDRALRARLQLIERESERAIAYSRTYQHMQYRLSYEQCHFKSRKAVGWLHLAHPPHHLTPPPHTSPPHNSISYVHLTSPSHTSKSCLHRTYSLHKWSKGSERGPQGKQEESLASSGWGQPSHSYHGEGKGGGRRGEAEGVGRYHRRIGMGGGEESGGSGRK